MIVGRGMVGHGSCVFPFWRGPEPSKRPV
jgi:hypothetical protein